MFMCSPGVSLAPLATPFPFLGFSSSCGDFYFLAVVTTWVPSVRALNLITMEALRAPQVNLQPRLPPCRSFLRMQLPARPAPWLADRPPQLHTSQTNPWGAPHPRQTSQGFYISANGILFSHRPKYQSSFPPFLSHNMEPTRAQ